MRYNTKVCNAAQKKIMWYDATQYNEIECNVMLYNTYNIIQTLKYNTTQYNINYNIKYNTNKTIECNKV